MKKTRNILKYFSTLKPHLFSWGCGEQGRTGHNEEKTFSQPRGIPNEWFRQKTIKEVVCGNDFAFAISDDNSVFCWGNNNYGQLGIHDRDNCLGPLLANEKNSIFDNFVQISCGKDHSLAVDKHGQIFSWGKGGNFLSATKLGYKGRFSHTPKKIETEKTNFSCVSAGGMHSAALTDDGEVYTWGKGEYGILGHGDKRSSISPQKIEGIPKIKNISLGHAHAGLVSDEGELFVFGRNDMFQLGIMSASVLVSGASYDARSSPTLVDFFSERGIKIEKVFCGEEYTSVITEEGKVWFWGKNVIEPKLVDEIENAKKVSIGTNHMIFLTSEETFVKGYSNWYGQMGIEENQQSINISQIFSVNVPKPLTNVCCGENFTIGIIS